jgi:hypothetical protein
VSEADLTEIATSLVRAAKGGDLQATKILFVYIIGPAPSGPDPDRVDVHEQQIMAETNNLHFYGSLTPKF